jgi:hypothetical protein
MNTFDIKYKNIFLIGLTDMDAVRDGIYKRREVVLSYSDEHFVHSNKEMRYMRKSYLKQKPVM